MESGELKAPWQMTEAEAMEHCCWLRDEWQMSEEPQRTQNAKALAFWESWMEFRFGERQ